MRSSIGSRHEGGHRRHRGLVGRAARAQVRAGRPAGGLRRADRRRPASPARRGGAAGGGAARPGGPGRRPGRGERPGPGRPAAPPAPPAPPPLAPPGYHLLVDDRHLALSVDPAVRHSRPSIDVLFDSAARSYGPRAVGVVLTGANDDGARGLATLRRRGGYAIVQDPAGAEVPQMPRAALHHAGADAVLALAAIPPALVALVGEGR